MSRLSPALSRIRAEGRTALIAYLTAGFPEPEGFLPLVRAAIDGGADVIEVGIPFSDPVAEGPTIQHASFVALRKGVTPAFCLDSVRRLRLEGIEIPLLLMGYYNPILARGLEVFAAEAAAAGVDGLIVVDLPPEESAPLREACNLRGLDLVYLLAPTSTPERMEVVARQASGFIYCVSVTGVTGARAELPPDLVSFVAEVRQHTVLPLAVGFGISRREHVEAVGRIADAVVVGSALIDVINDSPPEERESRVKAYVEVLAGRRRAASSRQT